MEFTLTKSLFSSILVLCSIFLTSNGVGDTIAANQAIRDGETIVSEGGFFELGFFSPSNTSQDRYLGIWYKKLATGTVVWVANRGTPLSNSTGKLTLSSDGNLLLQDSDTNSLVWMSNATGKNPVARIMDNGNLIISGQSEGTPGNIVWQSFDDPGDTFLAGMKLGKNLRTGIQRNITSWKSEDDPSIGENEVWMDVNGYPQLFRRKGPVIEARLGPWNGLRFTGMPSLKPNPIYTFEFVFNQEEIYYQYELVNESVLSRMRLTPQGSFLRLNWIDRTHNWLLYSSPTTDRCALYALCGAYGSCNIVNTPPCGCLTGFEPKTPEEWNLADWSGGCQRKIRLDCGSREGFRKYSGVKLPDTRRSWFDQNMTLKECEMACRRNCSCTAYTNMDIRDGSGCFLWFGELIDIRELPENGQDIYIRMAASELGKDENSNEKRRLLIIIIPILAVLLTISGLCLLHAIKRRKLRRKGILEREFGEDHTCKGKRNDLELPLFTLSTLLGATNNFSIDNKVGEGGFGPVYKGVLKDWREIAVKRLSETSTQGTEEFKNEVACISKLHHRNLVNLLGFCVEGEERMLVYEYMPNRGLDSFLFDKTKSKILDWPKRFEIINGIARGLLYLHEDSRLRIIHRDLKAGNVLLDFEMNPKISDFGMARSFGGNEIQTNTRRVVGTYGYMSPEYAGDGIFSIKSDVFSFGVLVLEIVSGKKNRGFVHVDHHHNLLGHAWKLHKEGRSLELADLSMIDSCHLFEVLISIQVGLLCVQHCPEDRPNMSSVVSMLSSGGGLPQPKQPGFFTEDCKFGPESSSSMPAQSSTSEITLSLLEAR